MIYTLDPGLLFRPRQLQMKAGKVVKLNHPFLSHSFPVWVSLTERANGHPYHCNYRDRKFQSPARGLAVTSFCRQRRGRHRGRLRGRGSRLLLPSSLRPSMSKTSADSAGDRVIFWYLSIPTRRNIACKTKLLSGFAGKREKEAAAVVKKRHRSV